MREDQHTEFKRIWKDDYLKELCAFANSQGGLLYLGVDNNEMVCWGRSLHLKKIHGNC